MADSAGSNTENQMDLMQPHNNNDSLDAIEVISRDISSGTDFTVCPLPQYLRQLLIYNGFDNIISLSEFNEQDFLNLEAFAKKVLPKLMKDEADRKQFYGIYAEDIELFSIAPGHKKLLYKFVKLCNEKECEKKRLVRGHATLKRKQVSYRNPTNNDNSEGREEGNNLGNNKRKCSNATHEAVQTSLSSLGSMNDNSEDNSQTNFPNDEDERNKATVSTTMERTAGNLKNTAKQYIKKYLTQFEKTNPNYEHSQFSRDSIYDLDKITVTVCKSLLFAKIKCHLCQFTSSISSTDKKYGKNWVMSNFNKHFKTHFKNSLLQSDEEKVVQKSLKNSNLLSFVTINTEVNPQSRQNFFPPSLNSNQVMRNIAAGMPSERNEKMVEGDIINTCRDTSSLTFFDESEQNFNFSGENIIIQLNDSGNDPVIGESSLLNNDDNTDLENTEENTEVAMAHQTVFMQSRAAQKADSSAKENSSPQSFTVNYSERRRRKLANIGCTESQTKLTEFYSIIATVKNIIKSDPKANEIFCTSFVTKLPNASTSIATGGLLDLLKDTAIKNSQSKIHGHRFQHPLKLFCLYTFIIGGRLLYETLYSNLHNALPSISTINRALNESQQITEGVLRINELKSFLTKRKYPMKVFVSEDQTAILKRVQYEGKSNKMVGFLLPLSEKTGFPETDRFICNSVMDIQKAFSEETISHNAYVFMAQPLVNKSPAFCLAIFGSDNKFTNIDVLQRWKYIKEKAAAVGIEVEGFASDGDTRCLKAMRIASKLNMPCPRSPSSFETSLEQLPEAYPESSSDPSAQVSSKCPYSPYFKADYDLEKPVVIQDTVHISTKMKTRLLKDGIILPMGKRYVSKVHLEMLIDNYGKDVHLLCQNYLNAKDKMNFEAIDKLSGTCVTDLLTNIPESEATRQYLILTRYILDAFLNKGINILTRVYYLWYATFFIRLWRKWILKTEGYTLKNNCITSNTYTCIELNAHGLLMLIDKCRKDNVPTLFLPWYYSSQPCEKIFRQTRSMTTTYSTVVNFSIIEILRRLNRIQAINDITNDLSETFHFPREENNRRLGDISDIQLTTIPSTKEILEELGKAKTNAIDDCRKLGILKEKEVDSDTEQGLEEDIQTVSIPFQSDKQRNEEEDENENDSEDDEDEPIRGELELSDSENDNEIQRQIIEDSSIFSQIDTLNLKNYSKRNKSFQVTKGPYLKVTLNNSKVITVRKSSLCWYFGEKSGRLSSDRILRVRGMTTNDSTKKGVSTVKVLQNNKKKKEKKRKFRKAGKKLGKKQPTKQQKNEHYEEYSHDDITASSESGDESDSYTSQSDTLTETFSEDDSLENKPESQSTKIIIKNENYYSVYYDSGWYIGRVLSTDTSKSTLKFLSSDLDHFSWPRIDDIDTVENKFIIYGPIQLLGNNPFQIKRHDRLCIQNAFKQLKRS